MFRPEDAAAGTTTTGTGPLTLAAVPSSVGAVDLYVALTAAGYGFANGNAVPGPYIIAEYTDSTFTKIKNLEKGFGTWTLGASLAASTLTRTTVQVVSNANANTYTQGAGATAITIGTAANVLVFVGASAADIPAYMPYFEGSGGGGDNLGASPQMIVFGTASGSPNIVTVNDYYMPFEWKVPMLVKKASFRVQTAYATGSPVSNAYARIYAVNSAGRPGKLLIDFGLLGSAGTSLNATGAISSAVHASGYFLTPGLYFMDFIASLSGGSTAPKILQCQSGLNVTPGFMGLLTGGPAVCSSALSGTAGAAPDPANLTTYTVAGATVGVHYYFALKDS